jgi:chorismate synthase
MIFDGGGLKIEIRGASHGASIGLRLSGVPAGEPIDLRELQAFADRRRASGQCFSTRRLEPDQIRIISGIGKDGATDGGVIDAEILNTDTRGKDYENLKAVPRPSHADYPAFVKYGGKEEMSGGGKFSGRLTAPLAIAGGIAAQIIRRRGVEVAAYIKEIGGIKGAGYSQCTVHSPQSTVKGQGTIDNAQCTMHNAQLKDKSNAQLSRQACHSERSEEAQPIKDNARKSDGELSGSAECRMQNAELKDNAQCAMHNAQLKEKSETVDCGLCTVDSKSKSETFNFQLSTFNSLKSLPFPALSNAEAMLAEIEKARAEGDSVGGVIECAAFNVPAGLGEFMFDSFESRLSCLLFGIPAVKGVEFGAGFGLAGMRGSAANDAYYMDGGAVKTRTNNNGGILGGLTTGMPIVFRVAVKPTPSIGKKQSSVDLRAGQDCDLEIKGRHDACIVPRAVVVVEACCALTVLDCLLTG